MEGRTSPYVQFVVMVESIMHNFHSSKHIRYLCHPYLLAYITDVLNSMLYSYSYLVWLPCIMASRSVPQVQVLSISFHKP